MADRRTYWRKVQMLELFTRNRELMPAEFAQLAGWYPARDAWTYLRRHWRNGLLRRGRNWSGRLVYSLSPQGARYLLWWKAQFPNERIRV